MRRALAILPRGAYPERDAVATVTLGWDERHRRRLRIETDAAEPILLDLAHAARLNDGDALRLDDGALIRVRAAPEPVMRIGAGRTDLARLAYHLGNRHLAVELHADALVIRADEVIALMVLGLGGTVERLSQPFSPEPGAYAGGHHGHDHD